MKLTTRARTALAFIGLVIFLLGVMLIKDAAILSLVPIAFGLALVFTANTGE